MKCTLGNFLCESAIGNESYDSVCEFFFRAWIGQETIKPIRNHVSDSGRVRGHNWYAYRHEFEELYRQRGVSRPSFEWDHPDIRCADQLGNVRMGNRSKHPYFASQPFVVDCCQQLVPERSVSHNEKFHPRKGLQHNWSGIYHRVDSRPAFKAAYVHDSRI